MNESLRFRPCHKLRASPDFDRVYRGGRRSGDPLFAVNALPNDLGFARLGMSVSTKSAGNSVRRNRVRRLIRELFRLRHAELPALDYVVTSRPGVRTAEGALIRTSLDRLFKDATRKAMAMPSAH